MVDRAVAHAVWSKAMNELRVFCLNIEAGAHATEGYVSQIDDRKTKTTNLEKNS